jgi:hypothetical protein
VRIVFVLGSAGERLDRHRNGCIRHADLDAPGQTHLRGGERGLL